MADAAVQIQVREGDATQLAAWNRLWRRLLSDGELSNDGGANATPQPVDKTDAGPNGEH
jgi:hypothetical protein